MLTRLATALLTFSLASNVAGAGQFAQPPAKSEARVAMPVRLEPTRAEVRAALEKRRDHNLAAFRAYRKAGVYPHNFIRVGPLNVWRDSDGHLCAAATRIDRDGKHQLVQDTGDKNDFIRLLDVTDGALYDWMLTSGFTIEEIDRIQAPMIQPDLRDSEWIQAENTRLAKEYAATDTWLVKHRKAGLETAVNRLMAHPDLARALVSGEI